MGPCISQGRQKSKPSLQANGSREKSGKLAASSRIKFSSRTEDYESFNQLVCTMPLRTKGCVMSNLDRVSGSFLALIVGGLAILCGGLIFIVIGGY
jgi:hypothetical protein